MSFSLDSESLAAGRSDADLSPAGLERLLQQAAVVLESETDYIANAANLSSLIYHNISDLNWAGFYFLRADELVLGPFQGQLACTRIKLGNGVCGKAFNGGESLMVNDVLNFAGHIACDAASRSEIVVPFYADECSGVLDIDSPSLDRFTPELLYFFERITALYRQTL